MPRFEAFTGLRYSLSHVRSLEDVICPPYDVISDPERIALEGRSPYNVVRLELPHGEADRYVGARRLLDAWRDGGIMQRDSKPAFYGYRMSYRDPLGAPRQTVGVIGALGLEEPGRGILPHEETTPKAKTDRLELIRATRSNLSPIWVLSPTAGLSALLEAPEHPAEHARDAEGVTHEVWPITAEASVRAISEAVGANPVLVADGHHRYETALTFQEELRSGSSPQGGEGYVMALAVELADSQLNVQAIHRLIVGLPAGFDIVAGLSEWFDLVPAGPVDRSILARMEESATMGVLTEESAWLARPTERTLEAAAYDLDSSRLDVALSSLPEHTVVYQHGWDDAAAAVATGAASAAVLLRPATVEQISAVSRGASRMPPKTTFFWPKPRTGMVIRELAC